MKNVFSVLNKTSFPLAKYIYLFKSKKVFRNIIKFFVYFFISSPVILD